MSTNPLKIQKIIPENKKRSEEELIEEEIRNQRSFDIFTDSDKNWCGCFFLDRINKIVLRQIF